MRKFAVGTALTVLILLSSCKCGLEKNAVKAANDSQDKIFVEYIDLCKKSGMTAEQIDNRTKLVESARRDMEALRKAVEGK